ncbi:hypothetical protein ACLOJK_019872 [Asimina triloba]
MAAEFEVLHVRASMMLHMGEESRPEGGYTGNAGDNFNISRDMCIEWVTSRNLCNVSKMNQEIRQLKKEVHSLKEVDQRHELDASVIKRNQFIMGFVISVILAIVAIHPAQVHKGATISFAVEFGGH